MRNQPFWSYIRLTVKVVLLCWILHDVVQYYAQRIVMAYVYPAQNYFEKGRDAQMQTSLSAVAKLTTKCEIKQFTLEKDGLKFNGWTICDPALKDNGKWVLQAVGNSAAVECYIPRINEKYAAVGYNTLLINNPGVGFSQGIASPKSMGAVQSLALSFIENEMKGTLIVLAGHSLGGAAIGQAILQHKFKDNIQYLVIQQMTFGKLSIAAKKMNPAIKLIAKPLIFWTGLEMDTVAASRKLADLNIDEYIINRQDLSGYTHDGVIPGKATLGHSLKRASIFHRKITDYPDTPLDFEHNSSKFLELTAKIIGKWEKKVIHAENP